MAARKDTTNARLRSDEIDITGLRFGRLAVIEPTARRNNNRQRLWSCRCDCGKATETTSRLLRTGQSRSCGCYKDESSGRRLAAICTKHGKTETREYHAWCGIKGRCENPNNNRYRHYGARGIRVCDQWRNSFEAFLAEMGPSPSPAHSIDRIDNDGDYEPGNCRWATDIAQANNKRSNWLIEHRGETMTITSWSARTGINRATLAIRLNSGWSVEAALTTPVRPRYWKKSPPEAQS